MEQKRILTMQDLVSETKLKHKSLTNAQKIQDDNKRKATALLPDVVKQAQFYMEKHAEEYETVMNPKLNQELEKLDELEKRYGAEISLFQEGRLKRKKQREIDELFDSFVNWVTDTLTIQKENPYLKVLAVVCGVE